MPCENVVLSLSLSLFFFSTWLRFLPDKIQMHRDFLDRLQQAHFSMFKPAIIIKENKTAQGASTARLKLHEYTVKLMT